MKNALSLGTFDGVHKGHRAVLELPKGYRKIAVTFAVPPKAHITGEYGLIKTQADKEKTLKKIGINEILTLDFSTVKDMSAEDFLLYLWQTYEPALISCGFNYRFGKDGRGDTELLKKFCSKRGIELFICEPVGFEGGVISSSLIRELLKKGEILKANELLGEPFSFEAEVIRGDKRGRTIGFPTVNQKYPEEQVKVRFGVYKTKVSFEDKEYYGITDIGIRPTYKSDYVISETFIKDFCGDLYGKALRVSLLEFIRDEKKFSSLEQLQAQLKDDLKNI